MNQKKYFEEESFWTMVAQFGQTNDFSMLRLRHHGDEMAGFAILQAEMRHHHRRKLKAVFAADDRFVIANALAGEQSTSCELARFHASLVEPGSRVADLTSGLGVDVMAMAARGCQVRGFDLKPDNVDALRHNVARRGWDSNVVIECGDSLGWLAANGNEHFDTIFIDPARRDGVGRRVYGPADCQPDVVSNLQLIMGHCRRLIVKLSPMVDITALKAELPGVETIFSVGTPTECKELVAVVDHQPGCEVELKAVTIVSDRMWQITEFRPADTELKPRPAAGLPQQGDFLYEPWPAVMKLQMGAALAGQTGVEMVGASTNLFVSRNQANCFPGNHYRIVRAMTFDRRTAKSLVRERLNINVATRNFPLSAPELVAKLKIKEGGERKLFGARCADNTLMLLECEPESRALNRAEQND